MKYFKPYYIFEALEGANSLMINPSTNMKDNYEKVIKCIDLTLKGLNLKYGKELLKEIPMVETRLGIIQGSVRTTGNAGRGLWQIDEISFKEIKRNPKITKYLELAKKNLGLDFTKLVWNDCNKLLVGCVVARLLMMVKDFTPNDSSRLLRAKQWKKYYNTYAGTGTIKKYWSMVAETYKTLGIKDFYENISYEQALNPKAPIIAKQNEPSKNDKYNVEADSTKVFKAPLEK